MTVLARHIPRQPVAPDDIDGCVVMYADEPQCECLDEFLIDVTLNERGQPICKNCGERRI
jgi:hypothetical protein